jgi:pyrimidine and pyridine-specific 5'-nucleotidase
MSELIDDYFMKHLSLDRAEAYRLHQEYYTTYGLAIEGLVRNHEIDPLEYNEKVDDALPLEEILSPEPELRKLLLSIDKSKVKLWLFTNAYVNHGRRVVKILGVDDIFEGLTYCDYAGRPLICKPAEEMFNKAMREAGVSDMSKCYFVGESSLAHLFGEDLTECFIDDSALNCRKAQQLGWTTVHLVEPSVTSPPQQVCKYQVAALEELRGIFPQFFKEGN